MSNRQIDELRKDYEGHGASELIEALNEHSGGQPIHVARATGLVFAIERRSAKEIADSWSNEVYSDKMSEVTYTARNPVMKSRHVFVADFADVTFGLKGKRLVDFGAGEGQFLEIARQSYGATPFGVEPSARNCKLLKTSGIDCFEGTIEDFRKDSVASRKFDAVTLMWTLCNVSDCIGVVEAAHATLAEGGHLVIAESSRIMVPFKKPLYSYMSPNVKADLHPWHFSANTLRTLLEVVGFEVVACNRYYDHNDLVVVGQKKRDPKRKLRTDDFRAVLDFFKRWDADTRYFDHFIKEDYTP